MKSSRGIDLTYLLKDCSSRDIKSESLRRSLNSLESLMWVSKSSKH